MTVVINLHCSFQAIIRHYPHFVFSYTCIANQYIKPWFTIENFFCKFSNGFERCQINFYTYNKNCGLEYKESNFMAIFIFLPMIFWFFEAFFNSSIASVKLEISATITRHPLEARASAVWKPIPENWEEIWNALKCF